MTTDPEIAQEEYTGKVDWKNAQKVATGFFAWLHHPQQQLQLLSNNNVSLTASVDRDKVHDLFVVYAQTSPSLQAIKSGKLRRLESLVMAAMKRQKKLKSKRYNDGVVACTFACSDGTFATYEDRVTARDKMRTERRAMEANKGGVTVSNDPVVTPDGPVLPVQSHVDVQYYIVAEESPVDLVSVTLKGPKKKQFQLQTAIPCTIDGSEHPFPLKLSFRTKGMALYRVDLMFEFRHRTNNSENEAESFIILRSLCLKVAGDQALYEMLQPKAPYQKRTQAREERPVAKDKIFHPPDQRASGSYKNLKQYRIPVDVREMVAKREAETSLEKPSYDTPDDEFSDVYKTFWHNLLWMSELQTHEDIKLFDMEQAVLKRHGKCFKLFVPGLAEGRPSVLRGDIVICNWKGKQYRGRVASVELLDVLLEFHQSFHKSFNVNLDRVELVRFTVSRTTYRTSHQGCELAPVNMTPTMLMPQQIHKQRIEASNHQRAATRIVPNQFAWATWSLNPEQKNAVQQVALGVLRPMPYVIFGPPGTGKTTTVVETVYQLARLNKYNQQQKKLKILLVAPSNDATDLLVEKLSVFFPPSEMLRVLAYTRSISDVPITVRPYCRDGMELSDLVNEIGSFQIVVSTVNLAARFTNLGTGIPKGYFDVVCIDEAGHATEPEVIAVVATLLNFSGNNPGQMIMAGDPNQLGPVITSDVCKKLGMGMSYMERLVITSPAYSKSESAEASYPPELVTLLVRNYRSHPAILKLPNELFYDNKLLPCGDHLTTHSMAKWEHLPTVGKDFPVIFHAIDGENLREGNSPSWFNPQEVVTVVEYVDLLINQSRPAVKPEDIGIITPYARQVQKIRLALKAKNLDSTIKVGSVETFQGQERRCIILSTVRSEQSLLSHDVKYDLGFVANEKRFNVAVTRAKALLVVIGNPSVLATDKKNWLPFLRYCRDHQSWEGDEWMEQDDDDDLFHNFDQLQIEDDHCDDEWGVVPDGVPQGFINREE